MHAPVCTIKPCRIYVWPKFLSKSQCQDLVTVAAARLAPSSLALRSGETEEGTRYVFHKHHWWLMHRRTICDTSSRSNIRTSQGTFMAHHEDPSGVLEYIEEKVARLTGLPRNYGESFNILRYKLGQHYDSHYDYCTWGCPPMSAPHPPQLTRRSMGRNPATGYVGAVWCFASNLGHRWRQCWST